MATNPAATTAAAAVAVTATTIVPSPGQSKPAAATSVVVESSRFDASQMKMEDFTSQRLQDDFDVSAAAKQDDIPSVSSSSPTPSQKSPGRSEGMFVHYTLLVVHLCAVNSEHISIFSCRYLCKCLTLIVLI